MMSEPRTTNVVWRRAQVESPVLDSPVAVICATAVPYVPEGNRFQTLNLYLRETDETLALVGKPADQLPRLDLKSGLPGCLVHIHGGAWRDPQLTASSIEPTAAHAFTVPGPIVAIASLNYTISPFPTHPTDPYDPSKAGPRDPARDAVHPAHLRDVLVALGRLRSFGLDDRSFLLSGHSCGACLAFQSALAAPLHFGLADKFDVPTPAAILGFNGLYDLPALVDDLDGSHAHLRTEYDGLLSIAFGRDRRVWERASPARISPGEIATRVRDGDATKLVLLDQSAQDQLVPMNQRDRLSSILSRVPGLQVVEGNRCFGKHADAWERGDMIWFGVQDALALLNR